MPRSRSRRRKKKQQVDDDHDDADDTGSQNSVENLEIEEKPLATLVDDLTQKRAATRLAALRVLYEKLSHSYCVGELGTCVETLTDNVCICIRKGGSKERMCALQVWCAAVFTMGDAGSESVLTIPSEHVLAMLRDTNVSGALRAMAAGSVALATFVACEQPEFTATVMETFVQLLSKTKVKSSDGGEILAALIQGWTLLMTTLRRRQLKQMQLNIRMRQLIQFLDSPSLDVRNAAGECIAFLYEEVINKDESDSKGADLFSVNWREVTAQLRTLSTDSNRRQAKKDRRLQRSIFREVVRTIEDHDSPTADIVIGTEKHTFTGWGQLRQLDAFRSLCGTGLINHMTDNPVASGVFGLDFNIGRQQISLTDKRILKRDQFAVSKQNERFRRDRDQKKRADKRAHVFASDYDE